MAVLTEKLKPKESASGRAFSMWRLSDLQGTNLSLFLFGKAHEELWKDQFEGAVVAVWGPQVGTQADDVTCPEYGTGDSVGQDGAW